MSPEKSITHTRVVGFIHAFQEFEWPGEIKGDIRRLSPEAASAVQDRVEIERAGQVTTQFKMGGKGLF